MRPNTTVVYTESPGSHTFEVQDVPALARAAHARGAKVLMDNTWGIHHFQPFTHGVDVSIQAATKYPAGHSDILIGSVTVNTDADWHTLHATLRALGPVRQSGRLLADAARAAHDGSAAGAADGIRHRGRPLAEQAPGGEAGAASGAAWRARPRRCGSAILPALAACSASSSSRSIPRRARMRLWRRWTCSVSARRGAASKVWRCRRRVPSRAPRDRASFAGPLVRLHIGLEDVADLIADLEQGLKVMREFGR